MPLCASYRVTFFFGGGGGDSPNGIIEMGCRAVRNRDTFFLSQSC